MRSTRILVLALAASLALAACSEVFGEEGSGNVVSETRDVSGFSEIVVLGSGEITVEVTGTESLTIEAEDNLIPLLKSDVDGNRLELGPTRNISPTRPIRYTITAAQLEAVTINGSGDVRATGVDTDAFDVDITGSGTVTVDGTTGSLSVEISGSGEYEGEALVAADGSVRISGSGSAVMNVTDDLEIDISGSGDVVYLGDPEVSQDISGSGDVSRR